MVLSDLQVLTEKKLSNVKGIRHGFFTRKGGVSDGIYSSLNVGYGCIMGGRKKEGLRPTRWLPINRELHSVY